MLNRPCSKCNGTRWYARPTPSALGRMQCGGAGMPCDQCNPAGGLDDPPALPEGFRIRNRSRTRSEELRVGNNCPTLLIIKLESN
jgi:hypothetical protein